MLQFVGNPRAVNNRTAFQAHGPLQKAYSSQGSTTTKVLLIEDDAAIRDALAQTMAVLHVEYTVMTSPDGKTGLQSFFETRPDVVVLDIGLPFMGGLEVLERIREVSSTPIIMLTARDGEIEVSRALEMGADDYVTKPFGWLELVARIKAQARRTGAGSPHEAGSGSYTAEGLTLYYASHEVFVDDKRIPLTNTEYRLLCELVRNTGRVVPHHVLLEAAWGSENYTNDVIRVYISRLRSKIEAGNVGRRYIFTRPGVGYVFMDPGAPGDHEAEVTTSSIARKKA